MIFTHKTLSERISSHADVDWLSSWHRSTFLVRGKLILRVYGTAARRWYSAGGCSFERWSSSGAYPPLRRRSSSFQGQGADNSSPSSCVISAFADLETFSFFVLLVCLGKLSPPSVDGVDNFCLSLLRVVVFLLLFTTALAGTHWLLKIWAQITSFKLNLNWG